MSFAATPSTAKAALQKHYQNIQSWGADFSQETFVEMLGKIIRKKGQITVKKPGKLKINYTEVPLKTYLSNGKRLWIYSEESKEVQVFKKVSKLITSKLSKSGGKAKMFFD